MTRRLPKLLYHYTDSAGLIGILQSAKVRLSDTRFVNDKTELTFASSVIHDTLVRSDDDRQKLLASTRILFFPGLAWRDHTIFACSMSETPDSISQWQRYGGDGHGYCIGFDARALVRVLTVLDRRPTLHRMEYDKKRQQHAVRLAIEEFRRREPELAKHFKKAGEDWRQYRRYMLAIQLAEVAVTIKNPWFKDEKEWRLLLSLDERDKYKYVEMCSRGPYLRPYVDAAVQHTEGSALLPIRKIVCGPRLDEELAVQPIRELVRLKGYEEKVHVSQSSLAPVWR